MTGVRARIDTLACGLAFAHAYAACGNARSQALPAPVRRRERRVRAILVAWSEAVREEGAGAA